VYVAITSMPQADPRAEEWKLTDR